MDLGEGLAKVMVVTRRISEVLSNWKKAVEQ